MTTQEQSCAGLDCAWCINPNCSKDQTDNEYKCRYYHSELCSTIGVFCSAIKNCYYKKWQREIQKNENLIKISDTRQGTIINLARRKKELENALKKIKIFANEECERECDFNFCKGKTDETTCVIHKIKEVLDAL